MQQQPEPGFVSPPTPARHVAPCSPSIRPGLPERNVTLNTIEDAYVQFILFCNPAVPPETDTAALREQFQTPPKSGGKTFNTFTLFQLIKQLEMRELRTWAELALKLGVEPPDQDKGQSSQKIQQYSVRLKRWMHSMHVDAFFEYLMNRPNTYWTEVPSGLDVSEYVRDGVAAEDDMALRALLPSLKPRRGRRKPEDDDAANKSPSQQPRIESPPADEAGPASARPGAVGPWSAHPDGRGSVFLFPVSDPLRLSAANMGQPSGPSWTNSDMVQTPLTAYPHSAITPVTRSNFWADEPRSAITPGKPRSSNKRHGAKVVSSAWRPGGTGKTRGRPPINRNPNDGPFSAFPTTDLPSFKIPPINTQRNGGTTEPTNTVPAVSVTSPMPASGPSSAITPTISAPTTPVTALQTPTQETHGTSARPAKRSRLSLQVPERVGGEVRLATPPPPLPQPPPQPPPPPPPPIVMVNSPAEITATHAAFLGVQKHGPPIPSVRAVHESPPDVGTGEGAPPFPPPPGGPQNGTGGTVTQQQQPILFEDPTDRTNIDELEGFFTHEILTANWFDAENNPIEPCGVDEAWGICNTVIENLLKAAVTKDAFLINLAALAGGKLLMNTTHLRITKLEEGTDRTKYRCNWELRLGDIKGAYSMEETVLHSKWQTKKRKADKLADGTTAEASTINGKDEDAGAEVWQQKYKDMCNVLKKRDQQLADLRCKVMQSLKEPKESI